MLLDAWKNVRKPVIGMLHLAPLPGSPLYGGSLSTIREAVLRDAQLLADGGVNGLMIENFGDTPFFPGRVPAHVVAHLTAIASEVRRTVPNLPLGINVLRNDGLSALAVAHAVGADYIRVNVLCGARVADQGLLQGIAHDLLRLRAELKAEQVRIFADVDVKHSAPLAARRIEDEVDDTLHRGMADALIVSGAGTGKPTEPEKVMLVKAAAKGAPVLLGSGVTPQTLPSLLPHADGFIVGTYFKKDGVATNAVDVERVRGLMKLL
jgi:membrane complex biogenesis BtpA family protein